FGLLVKSGLQRLLTALQLNEALGRQDPSRAWLNARLTAVADGVHFREIAVIRGIAALGPSPLVAPSLAVRRRRRYKPATPKSTCYFEDKTWRLNAPSRSSSRTPPSGI